MEWQHHSTLARRSRQTYQPQVTASSYLIVACRKDNQVKLLIYEGHEWKQRDGPYLEGWMVGCIIAHKGTVFLTESSDSSHFFYKISLNSLLTNAVWKTMKIPSSHSNLTVVGGCVTVAAKVSPDTLHVLGFSPISDSWIELREIKCSAYIYAMPKIVGLPGGVLLLMGRIRVKDTDPISNQTRGAVMQQGYLATASNFTASAVCCT